MLYMIAAIFLCLGTTTVSATGRMTPLFQINNTACIAENLRKTERYTCDAKGNVICIGGWSDPTKLCSIPICDMNGKDCINGKCVFPNVCACEVGWDGPNCEECIPLGGCKHGHCNRPMECNCNPGWTGGQCNIPKCDGCVNGCCYEPYKCICDFGWKGNNCTECKTLRHCKNGRCLTHPFQCECYDGWEGIGCSKPICRASCHPINGHCDEPGECICHNGWTGRECEECVPYPGCNGTCLNNVPWTCSDLDTHGNPDEWSTWSQWSTCSKSCGEGIQKRERLCPNSQGINSNCYGEIVQTKKCSVKNCRIDGNWAIWTLWSPCSKSCGTGYKIRHRTCSNPVPKYGGTSCNGPSSEKEVSLSRHCPIDGRWSLWKSWGVCSVSCGEGIRLRSRSCDSPMPTHGGKSCFGESVQNNSCNQGECPIDAEWSNWSQWTQCSKTCGQGQQHRIRECSGALFGGQNCIGNSTIEKESIPCWEQVECAIDGHWSTWSSWSQCTTSCGPGGLKTQQRQCNNPVPKSGGRHCIGRAINRVQCSSNVDCPIDGKWNPWNPWSTCSASCNGGNQNRERTCVPPQFGGKPCNGLSAQKRQCTDIIMCPADTMDGKWSLWGQWTSCSKTCEGGIRIRRRVCTEPKNGGQPCTGSTSEEGLCNENKQCHDFGNWSRWTSWSKCSKTCGNGSRTRNRICSTNHCIGQKSQQSSCNKGSCLVHGNWGKWTQWTSCTASCGQGRKSRSRLCNNPSPRNGGNHCKDRALESTSCFNRVCTINGNWGIWSNWSNCSASCGKGVQRRSRQCDNPRPRNNGKLCMGAGNQSQTCGSPNCPIDGGFSEWRQWSKCSADCIGDRGIQVRKRFCNTPEPKFGGRNCEGSFKEKRQCTGIFAKQITDPTAKCFYIGV